MIGKTLKQLNLRDEEIKAFICLLENGEQTIGTIARKTGISRPSLYGFTHKLKNIGLVQESQRNGIKIFTACSKEKIEKIFEEKINEFTKGKEIISNICRDTILGSYSMYPRFQLFEEKEGLKQVLKDILLYHDIETKAFWPVKSMVDILSESFFKDLNKSRVRQKIYTKVIWPDSQKIDIGKYPYLGSSSELFEEVRIAPETTFSMGYWIYGNKVAFMSSKKENFGFIVESKELVETLSSQFEVVWKLSKPFIQ